MSYEIYKHGPRKGQPKTLTDRMIRYLEEGMNATEKYYERSSRYRLFTHKNGNLWMGSAGAVRAGRTPSSSISITDTIKNRMILWEKTLPKLQPEISVKLHSAIMFDDMPD